MEKVDWITWKTDPKDIINPKHIEDSISEFYQDFNTFMNPIVYEQIKHEITNGGLSKESLVVSGESIAYEKANEILKLIDDVKEEMSSLKNTIIKDANDQKEIEKKDLIEKIEEKLNIEKIYLDNILSKEGSFNISEYSGNSPEEIKSIIEDRIQKLQERLDSVKAL